MNAEFYLFDVDHGQSAALRLPNGRWCVFDVGRTAAFSPIACVVENETRRVGPLLAALQHLPASFRFLKATVSHLHGDHLADYGNLFQHGPEYLRTVAPDAEYLEDCYMTCSDDNGPRMIRHFVSYVSTAFSPPAVIPNYGGVSICELSLPVSVARQIGGSANSRVNNASIVTRIDVYGNSILLCGDMEKEAWEFILGQNHSIRRLLHGVSEDSWRRLVSHVDILVAPHHGHRSAYSTDLLNLAKPAVVLVSVVSRDPNVDSRYSQPPVRGIRINGQDYKCITTRQEGHIKVEISPPAGFASDGARSWTFGDAALR